MRAGLKRRKEKQTTREGRIYLKIRKNHWINNCIRNKDRLKTEVWNVSLWNVHRKLRKGQRHRIWEIMIDEHCHQLNMVSLIFEYWFYDVYRHLWLTRRQGNVGWPLHSVKMWRKFSTRDTNLERVTYRIENQR